MNELERTMIDIYAAQIARLKQLVTELRENTVENSELYSTASIRITFILGDLRSNIRNSNISNIAKATLLREVNDIMPNT